MRNFLKKFKKAFCDVLKNNLRYEQIKDRVVITKNYDKSELLLHNSGLVALILLIALLGFILMLAARKGRCIEQAEHLVYFKDISEAAEWADYVFIARVEKKLYTKQYDGTGFRMPYSYYSLADIQFLKGEDACDKLLFYGGYSLWNQLIVFEDNTELPRPGEYYLFTVRKANAENTRVEADSYKVITKAQMLPLEDYIPDAGFDDQNDNNKEIILAFLQALEDLK